MKYAAIKKELADLGERFRSKQCFVLVEDENGKEKETTMREWYDNRHDWRWLKITKGGDNNAIFLLLAALDDEAAEDAMEKGDIEAATQFTASAAHYLAQYERG